MAKLKELLQGICIFDIVPPIVGILAFVMIHFIGKLDAVYSACYSIMAIGTIFFVCRFFKQRRVIKAPSFISSQIWGLIACLDWLMCILCDDFGSLTFLIGMLGLSIINCIGFDYLFDNQDPDELMLTKDAKVEKLAATLRFRLRADGTEGTDAKEALCLFEGKAMTPNEARDSGYNEAYKEALRYLKTIV